MHATSATNLSAPAPKPSYIEKAVRLLGGIALSVVHAYVVYATGRFIFVEYVAGLTDRYVWITPQPHEFIAIFVSAGTIGFMAAVAPLICWKRSVRWLLLSLAVVILEVPVPTVVSAQDNMFRYRSVNGVGAGEDVLNNFYKQSKRFPSSQGELDTFLPSQVWYHRLSWYAHRGIRLPYRYVYVSNATGPYAPNPPYSDPATVYCAVSGDLQHYWVTATDLRTAMGTDIVMAKDSSGVIVFDETLSKPNRK